MSRLSLWAGLIASGAILVGVTVRADAATYYLDPIGNDATGDGSLSNPWKTLYKAGQAVPARQGHVIHLKAGTYVLDASLNNFGTRAAVWINPGIFIEGENTATDNTRTVILTHQNDDFPGFGINVSTGSAETSPGGIRNLTIDGDNYVGTGGLSTLKISYFTVANCTFRNLSGNALRLAVTGDGTRAGDVTNLEVKDSFFFKTKGPCINGDGWLDSSIHHNLMDNSDAPGASASNPSPWGDSVRLNYVGSTRIHHNTMYAPSFVSPFTGWKQQPTQDTICLFYASGGNEVDNNVLSQWTSFVGSTSLNGYDKILKFHDNYVYFPSNVSGSGIELMFNDSDVYNNYFENTQIGLLTDPGAVSAGDTRSDVNNVRVFNNVFSRMFPNTPYPSHGVAFRNSTNTTANNWAIYNNVFRGFTEGYMLDGGGFINNLNAKNNVFLNNDRIVNWGYPTAAIRNSNFTNSVWHYTVGFDINPAPNASANVVFANNLPGNTASLASASASGLNLSGALPNPFYAPASASSLVVNAGTVNIAPGITLSGFSGSAPDIGVYEWAGGTTPPATGSGAISREVWTNVPGTQVSQIPVTTTPQTSDTLTSLEIASNAGDNYGTRVRGYITAPTTGNYTFWVAGDDNCELWLSTNDQPGSKVRIANVPDWTNSREWNKYATQKSVVIPLVAGQRYYVEVLHKEGGGGDNMAVGWAKPGQGTVTPSEVIPGSQLSPFAGGTVTPPPTGALIDRTTTPGGGNIYVRGSINSFEDGPKAFDDNTNTKWLDNTGVPNATNSCWVVYQFANAGYAVEQYTITSANDSPERDPRTWLLQGSNDGTNWTTLDSQSGQTFTSRFQKKTFTFSNTIVYKNYVLSITANGGSNMTQLSEIELFSR